MSVKALSGDSSLSTELEAAGGRTVVVDFTATWCPPCRAIAPFFQTLAKQYTGAVFLKVDVDVCSQIALEYNVSSMPTFLFFKNKTKIDSISGADKEALEAKVKLHCSGDSDAAPGPVPGYSDLAPYLQAAECECLNESSDHVLSSALGSKEDGGGGGADQGRYLLSDCDEQLIVSLRYNQPVRLHSLGVFSRTKNAPRTVALFINQPHTLDFEQAASGQPTQLLTLTPEQVQAGEPVQLRFVKFQKVFNVQMFFSDNQNGDETTRIDRLQLFGTPVANVNMDDFKRVAGKKGEAH